ncbi:MAG: hypothetical protein AAF360_09230 [Pseudomonadota bacterium]
MFDGLRWRNRLNEARTLLVLERRLLLGGSLNELARLDSRRSTLERHLLEMPDDIIARHRMRVEEIRRLALRNHKLLTAYLDGARRAAKRLAEIDTSRRVIGAYMRDGTRIDSESATTRVRRKA